MGRFDDLVNRVKPHIREVGAEEVWQKLERGEDITVVDVREASEWAKGHMRGAVHVSKGMLEMEAEKRFPDASRRLVLYCGGGMRSALAAENLQRMGYTNVFSMDGGFRAWKDAGFPIEE